MAQDIEPTPERFPLRRVACDHGDVAYREAGSGIPLVLLHGIGSGSGSWTGQLEGLAAAFRVIAWDAPGYGESTALTVPQPSAQDYADVLAQWLRQLRVDKPIVVGHSLGAIMGAAFAARPGAAVRALVLASPARGYGTAPPDVRESKHESRLALLDQLGIEGMAAQRAPRLCAPGASAAAVEAVRGNMARATAGGYRQAAHLLAHADLTRDLRRVAVPTSVVCGEFDAITPPDACRELALDRGLPFTLLHGVGHACYVEDPAQFNAALLASLTLPEVAHP